MPLVSVIVPVFNGADLIEETLVSIANQTVSDFECLVVDDCSTDASASVIEAFAKQDQRFRYLKTPQNFGGPAGPRNLGVQHAKSGLVAFCDADDLWADWKLEEQIALTNQVPAPIYASTLQNFEDMNTPDPLPKPGRPVDCKEISLSQMLVKNRIGLSGVMARRNVILEAGGFNTDRDYIAVEDYDLWLRVLEREGRPAVKMVAPSVHYRVASGSISRNKVKMLKKAMRVQEAHFARAGNARYFKMISPLRVTHYIASAIWSRLIQKKL